MNIPEPLPVYTAAYQDFKGVDFTSAICDRQHFPLAKNFIIKDTVEKRCGYEKIAEFEGRINGIYKFKLNRTEYTFVHAGDKIYKTNEDFSEPELLYDNVNDDKSVGYSTGKAFLILTGKEIIHFGLSKLYDNEEIVKVTIPADAVEYKYQITLSNVLQKLEGQYVFKDSDYSYNTVTGEVFFYIPVEIGQTVWYCYDASNWRVTFVIEEADVDTYNGKKVYGCGKPSNTVVKLYDTYFTLEEGTDYVFEGENKSGEIVTINSEWAGKTVYAYYNQKSVKVSLALSEKDKIGKVGAYVNISQSSDFVSVGQIVAKDGYEVIDAFWSDYGYLYVPPKYKGKEIELIYVSTNENIDTELEERSYFSSFRFADGIPYSKPGMHLYYNCIDIPVIRRGLKFFRSNSYHEESNPVTYDKLVYNHCGEADFEGYNLMSPYVAYEVDAYTPGISNSSSGYTQGFVIEGTESRIFGSQHAWFLFEDGRIFSAEVRKKKIYEIANASTWYESDEKKEIVFSFVTRDQNNDPIPDDYIGKPFKILFCHETAAKLWQENKLWQCTIMASMQYGNGLYYFYSGNKDFPNRDWHSEINEPLNVSSVNYTIYGVNDEVAGYGQYGAYLAVFKKGGNDKNIYVRQAQYIDSLGVTFPVSVGVGGAMPVLSPLTVENLAGETLYLTSDGIYALTTLSTTDFQVTKKRSYFVDGKLKKELDLKNAIACTWRGMYLLAVNGNVYILDGTRQKNFIESTSNEYSYECLFWDNIPARIFFNCEEELYFGCDNGKIMRFCDKHSDDGEPIDMVIATKLDDDGDFMSLKKMQKKGTGILVMPHQRSSFDISFRYDSNVETFVKKAYADIFSFEDIDFERFTFETSENPRIIPFLKKSKKYKALQIIIRSLSSEPFSLSGILKRYTINNYVKK